MTPTFDEMYAPLDPSKEGEWVTLTLQGHHLGYIWTDHEDGLGYRGFAPEPSPEILETLNTVQSLLRAAAATQLSTTNAFRGIVSRLSEDGLVSNPQTGSLQGLVSEVNTATAGASETGKLSNYILSIDEDGYVEGMGFISDEGLQLVRENGEWVGLADEEDPRMYGDTFYYVSEDAVAYFDSQRKVAKRDLTEDEFMKFTV